MFILLQAVIGARRARLVALISLAAVAAVFVAVAGGLFSVASQVKSAVSAASAAAPHAGSVPTTAPAKLVYHATPGDRVVTGPGFVTEYPAGWRHEVKTFSHKGLHATRYLFESGHRMPDAYGIPPAGEVAVTMIASPLAAAAKADPHQATQTPEQFLLYTVGFPKGYKQLGRVSPDSASTLGGGPAATLAISYVYHGLGNVQIDTVARHDGQVYFLEADSDPADAKLADGVLGQVMAGWQWR